MYSIILEQNRNLSLVFSFLYVQMTYRLKSQSQISLSNRNLNIVLLSHRDKVKSSLVRVHSPTKPKISCFVLNESLALRLLAASLLARIYS